MRKAAMLVLIALLATAMVFAQNPASTNSSQSTTPQTQNTTPTTAPDQSTTPGTTGQQNQPSTQTSTPDQNTQTVPAQNNTNGVFGQRAAISGGGDVSAGTEIKATLDTPLSTKTSKPGDRFTASVTQPIQGNGGTAIPAGSRIEGEVSEAEQGKAVAILRGKGKLNLRFRDIVTPSGQTIPLTATLVSVNSTNGKDTKKADNEGQVESSNRGKDVAKDVGIGAGIGTVAGLIFGGPLKGLAIGALAGGGYVLATGGKDVNLPAQTGMVLRLDQPLSVNSSNR